MGSAGLTMLNVARQRGRGSVGEGGEAGGDCGADARVWGGCRGWRAA